LASPLKVAIWAPTSARSRAMALTASVSSLGLGTGYSRSHSKDTGRGADYLRRWAPVQRASPRSRRIEGEERGPAELPGDSNPPDVGSAPTVHDTRPGVRAASTNADIYPAPQAVVRPGPMLRGLPPQSCPIRAGAMQNPGYGLPRIPNSRSSENSPSTTIMNKDRRKGPMFKHTSCKRKSFDSDFRNENLKTRPLHMTQRLHARADVV
jgi:hypothetical protein